MTEENYFEPIVWNVRTLKERRKNLDALSKSGKWTTKYPNVWERFSTCPVCQTEFFNKRKPHQIFCSQECYHKSLRKTPKTCPTCGIEHKNKVYCSKECQHTSPEWKKKLSKSMTKVMAELFPSDVRTRYR